MNTNSTKELAVQLVNIGALSWCSFGSFFVWLTLIFTNKDRQLQNKLTYLVLFILPVLFVYEQWNDNLLLCSHKAYYGWGVTWTYSIWTYLFYIYYLSCFMISTFLLLTYRKRTHELNKRKLTEIIAATMFISLTLGTITDVVLPYLNINVLPFTSSINNVIWAGGLGYAILKYKFLTITPALAAENIISTMTDCLILLSRKGSNIVINSAAEKLFGYSAAEVKNNSIEILLMEKDFNGSLLDNILKGETVKNYETSLRGKGERSIMVLFSSSALVDNMGVIAGVVCVVQDITERKRIEEEREILIAKLQSALADVKILRGLVPICSNCKKIRDDSGFWTQLESFIQKHSEATFSHGICPDCIKLLYPDIEIKTETENK